MKLELLSALAGGLVIGGAVSLMLLANGRVTGISGIVNGTLAPSKGDTLWRVLFIAGLFVGGLFWQVFHPEVFQGQLESSLGSVAIAGLLVGFGTVMGSGCTSGHGICGSSRLSPRSVAATVAFTSAGALAVFVFKWMGILP